MPALTGVIRAEQVSTEAHFFDDLGANSLLMARVCRQFVRIRACLTCRCVISTCIRLLPGLRIISIRRRLTVPSSKPSLKPFPMFRRPYRRRHAAASCRLGSSQPICCSTSWILWSGFLWAFASHSVVEILTRGASLSAQECLLCCSHFP